MVDYINQRPLMRSTQMENKSGSNKIIWVMFGLTGMISLIMWRWGSKQLKLGNSWFTPLTMSFEVKSAGARHEIKTDIKDKEITETIRKKTSQATGTYSWYVYRLNEKTGYGDRESLTMPGVSIMKVPIMAAALKAAEQGKISLDDTYTLQTDDIRTGSGPLEYYGAGTKLSIKYILEEMGKKSDNTAPVVIVNLIGDSAVESTMDDLKMTNSSYKDNAITAEDLAIMWDELYNGDYLNQTDKDLMREWLTDSIYEERIPAGLPDNVSVMHKVGTGDNVWGDTGIVQCAESSEKCVVKPFALTILNKDVDMDEARQLVPEITQLVYQHETERMAGSQ